MLRRSTLQWCGLAAGPFLALLTYLSLPHAYTESGGAVVAFGSAGRATLSVMVWMGVWWLTEAIDIFGTALLPLVAFPLLGIRSMRDAAAPYAAEVIFLFLGGFILAVAIQRWGFDRRVALFTLRLVGTRPANMVGGFMLATAAMSAFVSNTATAAMMLPIALSVVDLLSSRDSPEAGTRLASDEGRNFVLCLLLGIAYAASVGGIATLIGTPPNLFLAGFVRDTYGVELTFLRWLGVGLPTVAIFLPAIWFLLTRVIYPVRLRTLAGGESFIRRAYDELGPPSRGERMTSVVFALTALAWIFRPVLKSLEVRGAHPLSGLSDAVIAMTAALALFLLPVDPRRRIFAMDWRHAKGLPWGALILFGGGLSLAEAVQANQVAHFLGSQARHFAAWPVLLIVLLVVTVIIFLTELTSNTAITATLVPILAFLAPGLGIRPALLIVPATVAASCAFMMPVATPPNAIVFGSGLLSIPEMCRAGFWLNLLGIAVVTALAFTAVAWTFGTGFSG